MQKAIDFNPGPKILAIIDKDQWMDVDNFIFYTSVISGSGSGTKTVRQMNPKTGVTSSSTALVRTPNSMGWSRGKDNDVINWSKKILISAAAISLGGTTNGKTRFTLGKATADGVQALDDRGIGFEIDNLALKGLIHNGTDETLIDLSQALTVDELFTITIRSDGAGNMEWHYNGVSKGTSALGPTGDGAAVHDIIQLEVENNADSVNQEAAIHSLKTWMEQ